MARLESFGFESSDTNRNSPLSFIRNVRREITEARAIVNGINTDTFNESVVPDIREVMFDRVVAAKNALTAVELAQVEANRELGVSTRPQSTEAYLEAQQELMDANAAILGHFGLAELPVVCPIEEF